MRLPSEPVIEGMDIKPNLGVLDVGAGKGYFTFPIAERLKGTGAVFATDVDSQSIDHLRTTSAGKGLRNVIPVLVSKERFDAFYSTQVFDRILICHVYEFLHNPSDFLKDLRPSLREGTGRLFIVHPKAVPGFSAYHFRDLEAILTVLASAGSASPVFHRLNEHLQQFVARWDKRSVPAEYREALISDFRGILLDPSFYPDMVDYSYSTHKDLTAMMRALNVSDIELAKWLIVQLDAEGTLAKRAEQLDEGEKTRVAMLNQIILTSAFPRGLVRRYNLGNRLLPYVAQSSVISVATAAGYRLVRAHDVLPSHYFLEFARGRY
jgi:2-polyprenyl-3-methyl-5-hydroxy-6-metoxy-1,4-benzoquinol methylase